MTGSRTNIGQIKDDLLNPVLKNHTTVTLWPDGVGKNFQMMISDHISDRTKAWTIFHVQIRIIGGTNASIISRENRVYKCNFHIFILTLFCQLKH